jgi:biopolymer transport protein ExbB
MPNRSSRYIRTAAIAALLTLGPIAGVTPLLAQEGEPAVEAPADAAPPPAAESDPPAQPADGTLADEAVDPEAGAESGSLNYTFVELIQFGGIVGYIIIFLSLVAVALIIDDLLLLRKGVLLPADETEEVRTMVAQGRGAEIAAGPPRSSFIGAMAVGGLRELDRGYEAIVKGMEDAADDVTGRLLRRIEYLNVIANVAPMLGLLGTVMGMVKSFNTISVAAGGADPRLLAAGIFEALMTTVMGLIVAIPAFFAFSFFRNRVDALAAEAAVRSEELLSPLRPSATAPSSGSLRK